MFFVWFLIYLRVMLLVVVHLCPSISAVSTEDNSPEAAMTDLLPSMKIVFGLDT
jgi:hypothetical protein